MATMAGHTTVKARHVGTRSLTVVVSAEWDGQQACCCAWQVADGAVINMSSRLRLAGRAAHWVFVSLEIDI